MLVVKPQRESLFIEYRQYPASGASRHASPSGSLFWICCRGNPNSFFENLGHPTQSMAGKRKTNHKKYSFYLYPDLPRACEALFQTQLSPDRIIVTAGSLAKLSNRHLLSRTDSLRQFVILLFVNFIPEFFPGEKFLLFLTQ